MKNKIKEKIIMDKIFFDINNYFNVRDLFIDQSIADPNFYFFKENKNEIENFTHDDAINDWIIEKIRIFNESTFYLANSIENMIIYWNNIEKCEKLLRMEIRNTCINIAMYTDKIKSICGYYFFMNDKALNDGKEYIKTLKQFTNLNKDVNEFIQQCYRLHGSKSFQWIYGIRIAEIYNESFIEAHNYEFGDALKIIDKGYKISSETLLDNIKEVLELLLIVKKSFEKIITEVKQINIYNYIKESDNLDNVLKPGDRADKVKKITQNP